MNIPTIGGARGIFEIFVPGIFLLLNLGLVAYLLPFTDDETRRLIASGASNPVLSLIIAVSFGYLIGILLRLLRPELPDKLSAVWLGRFAREEHESETELWATEEFPYIGWIGEICKLYLPPETVSFYDKIWGRRRLEGQNKQFFNFVKVIISSSDERAAAEMYAAEALSRYISGMFYALSCGFFLILATILSNYFISGQILEGLILILVAYLLAIVGILARFRFIRIKEAEIVFAASFKNKAIFESDDVTEEQEQVSQLEARKGT
jgi:hypothetical protein